MFGYKKIMAFTASLLICTSMAFPVCTYAEEEISTESVSEELTDTYITEDTEITEDDSADSNNITSGDFVYSVIDGSTICIEGCISNETFLVIPDTIDGLTVTELSGKAFGNTPDRPYETISIPASVTYISEDNPFMYCQSLREIIVDSGNENYIVENGVLYTADKSLLICYPPKMEGNSFSIPEGVTDIGIAGIYGTQLEEIKFPSTLENIRNYALGGNTKLKSADMSSTRTETIGFCGLCDCPVLSEVIFPDTLIEIDTGAFLDCSSLAEVTLPESLMAVGQYAFTGTAMTSVTIPASVTSIGYCAFGYADETTPVDDFLIIGSYNSQAYVYSKDYDDDYDYKNDFDFVTPEAYAEQAEYEALDKDIYNNFEYAKINGEAVITAYYGTDSKVEIPAEIDGMPVTRIYTCAFESSVAEEIIIPESVKTIDKLVFYGCNYLKNLTMNGVETIGESAFVQCSSLENINISGNCKEIQGDEPFISCMNLQAINITDGDGAYSSENGVLYNKEKSALLVYPISKTDTEFKVPDGVKEISMSAFYSNNFLEKVDLSGVERICAYAFEGSKNLSKAVLSDSLKTVEIYAFADCPKLNGIRVYESTDDISDYAFGYYYDNTGNSSESDDMNTMDGFKIYADKNSTAYDYAMACGIDVVTGTIEIAGRNVVKGFLWAVGGVVVALIAGISGFAIFKKSGKKGK
ncbi:MAG: leucine-rich repeat domain-containing protein [Ruminococcus sp.]|nr:leucine-rich repeat domain-containing protein [Ruminococcus sp.]